MKKVILITGSSSGFGYVTAKQLAKSGHIVYASMRNVSSKNAESAKTLNEWALENEVKLKSIELDVTNQSSIASAIDLIFSNEGRIDVVINNAGVGGMGLSEDFSLEEVKKTFDVNVFGAFSVTKAVIPIMRKQKSGLIVSISSGFGRVAIPLFEIYCASKYALEGLAEGWRYELSPIGVDSVIVEPGPFPSTGFASNLEMYSPHGENHLADYGELKNVPETFKKMFSPEMPKGSYNEPELVAQAILNLIDLPAGKRPLRTVVDKGMEHSLQPLNELTDKIQSGMLKWMNVESLQNIKNKD